MSYEEDTLIEEIQQRQETRRKLKGEKENFENFQSKRKEKAISSSPASRAVELVFENGEKATIGSHTMSTGERRQFPAPNGNIYDVAIQPNNFRYEKARMCIDEWKSDGEGGAEKVSTLYLDFTGEQTAGVGNALLAVAEGRVEDER